MARSLGMLACALILATALAPAAAAPAQVTAGYAQAKADRAAAGFGGETLVRVHATDASPGDGKAAAWTFTYLTEGSRRGREVVEVVVKASGPVQVVREPGDGGLRGEAAAGVDSDVALASLRSARGWDEAMKGAKSADYDLLRWKDMSLWIASVQKGAGRHFFAVDAADGSLVTSDLARAAWRGHVDAQAGSFGQLVLGQTGWNGTFDVASSLHDALRVRFEVSFLGAPRSPTALATVTVLAPTHQAFVFEEPEFRPGKGESWLVEANLPPLAGTWTVHIATEAPATQQLEVEHCAAGRASPDPWEAYRQHANHACRGLLR